MLKIPPFIFVSVPLKWAESAKRSGVTRCQKIWLAFRHFLPKNSVTLCRSLYLSEFHFFSEDEDNITCLSILPEILGTKKNENILEAAEQYE